MSTGCASRIEKLDSEASDPKLWDDQAHAQKVTSELSHAQGELRRVEELRQRLDDLPVLYEMAAEEEGSSGDDALAEADAELKQLREDIEAMEVRTLLVGGVRRARGAGQHPLRRRRRRRGGLGRDADADVHPLGGAAQIPRRGVRHVLRRGGGHQERDLRRARAHSPTARSRSSRAPTGWCASARSTTRADGRPRSPKSRCCRSTETTDHIEIPENDVRVDVYRSSGPGGQSVNTTDSAVRLTHIPTGIVVTCQNEKSQLQNKVSAMRVLQAKLLERKRLEERAEMDALKGDGGSSWGNQMRSYVLHPYQMVKDLRTDYEVGNPAAVLDGDIDGFLEAGIRWRNRKDDE